MIKIYIIKTKIYVIKQILWYHIKHLDRSNIIIIVILMKLICKILQIKVFIILQIFQWWKLMFSFIIYGNMRLN